MTNYFQVGKNKILYVGDSFKKHFCSIDVKIPKKLKLKSKILEKWMLDQDILNHLKPKESNLGELAWALKNESRMLKNGYANIFYVRDKKNTLWAVNAGWSSDGWSVYAYSVTDPYGWDDGSQVFSQVFSVLKTLDSGDLEFRIKELEKFKQKVEKIINLT